jgi:chemotaxis protein CheD
MREAGMVGISDMLVVRGDLNNLVTHALGSCIGVVVYDPIARVGGLLHYLLPLSSLAPEDAMANPFKYGDTGIPALFMEAYRQGAAKDNLKVVMAGGGRFLLNSATDIGSRNIAIARRLFLKNRILLAGESVGGDMPRTLKLDMKTGNILCKEGATEKALA